MWCYLFHLFQLDPSSCSQHGFASLTPTDKARTADPHHSGCNIKQILVTLVCISRAHLESNNNAGMKKKPQTLPNIYLARGHCLPMADKSGLKRSKDTMEAPLGDITASSQKYLLFVRHRHMRARAHTHGTIGVSKCQSGMWIAAVITVKAGHLARRKTDVLNLPPSTHANCLAGRATILSRR